MGNYDKVYCQIGIFPLLIHKNDEYGIGFMMSRLLAHPINESFTSIRIMDST